jgi:hypothetical protein
MRKRPVAFEFQILKTQGRLLSESELELLTFDLGSVREYYPSAR